MTVQRSSATDPGAMLVAALAERDFDRLAGAFAPGVRMRALIPPGPVEISGAEAAAAKFASWFGEADGLELVHSATDEVGDRLHVTYRLRVLRPGDPWKVVEQHLFCALDNDRITALDLVCSGFRPVPQESLTQDMCSHVAVGGANVKEKTTMRSSMDTLGMGNSADVVNEGV